MNISIVLSICVFVIVCVVFCVEGKSKHATPKTKNYIKGKNKYPIHNKKETNQKSK